MTVNRVLVVGALALAVALGYRGRTTNRLWTEHLREDSIAAVSAAEHAVLRRGLSERLRQLQPGPLTLAGVEAHSGEHLSVAEMDRGLIYTIQTQCGICATNIPFLNEVHRAGVRVWGIVPRESREAAAAFKSRTQAQFPILSEPQGSAVGSLPTTVFPLTAVVEDGDILEMWLGTLAVDRVEQIRTRFHGGSGSAN